MLGPGATVIMVGKIHSDIGILMHALQRMDWFSYAGIILTTFYIELNFGFSNTIGCSEYQQWE